MDLKTKANSIYDLNLEGKAEQEIKVIENEKQN
jgi:hypothetical protein